MPDPSAAAPQTDASLHTTAAAVRAWLARAALGLAPRPHDAHVGPLTLHPHQRHAVARLRYALRHYRTALLADDVGLGKTAVALVILRDVPDAMVVAPAALRAHWTAALRSAALTRRLITTESLGRDSPSSAPASLIVVDEAHHFRNAATHRWRHLATLAADARVLLLSATPVHNHPADLATLFRLTLGDHANALDAPTLARLVVRRSAADVVAPTPVGAAVIASAGDRPTVAPTCWIQLDDAPAVRDALRSLPPAPLPQDGTATPDLDRYTLTRLWTSSDAALAAALQRRRARALTVADGLRSGLPPTRADLHALTRGTATDPTTQQLSLLTPADDPDDAASVVRRTHARQVVDRYVDALHHARDAVRATHGDARRIAELRAIRARHPDAHIVAFSWSADTVRALYRALAPDGRVAMLTAAGGRIASGPLSRADTLARFAPHGQARRPPAPIERISLLFTTDVLSEGLDLRDASVVVHLDLPWTPARLAQRTGRAVRPGAPAPVVHVYAFRPPAAAAAELRLVAHARAKRSATKQTVGTSPLEDTLALDDETGPRVRARTATHLARDRQLERWSAACSTAIDGQHRPRARRTTPAALRCGITGYVAVVSLPGPLGALRFPTLVAALDNGAPTTAPATVHRALAILARARVIVDPPPTRVQVARRQLIRWTRRRAARTAFIDTPSIVRDVERAPPPHAGSALLARATRALHAARPVDRAALAASAALLRDALAMPLSASRAAAIRDAAPRGACDAEWLVAAGRAAASQSGPGANARHAAPRATLRALVLLLE